MKKLFSIAAVVALLSTFVTPNAFAATYSTELEGAYDYAYGIGITTQSSIDGANMYGNLVRSHMAKMMVNYAKEVLGKTADTSATCSFTDISNESAELQGYIKEACQMGLMGVGITAFRPNDAVTRAEFGTVLSRALWGDANNGGEPYYVDHLDALKDAGVMTNISNPTMKEVRGYVMLMMQRADESDVANNQPAVCSTPENVLACSLGLDSCPAECTDTPEEEEEEVIVETKAGTLTVDLNAGTPSGDIPVGSAQAISRVPLLKFDVEAESADIVLHSLTLEFLGYGDLGDVDNVSIYDENNVKVSKTKNFSTEELTVSFINDYAVKKGGSETLTIVAELHTDAADDAPTTYGVSITDISSSAEDTEGLTINGNKLKSVQVTNQTVVDFTNDAVTDTLTVGEEAKLAAFSLENPDNYEDVTVQSITIQVDGVDEDIVDNLTLYADSEMIADDLEVVNGEIVANIDYVLEKDSGTIDFELKGSFSELDDDNAVFSLENADAVLAIGNKYGFNIANDVGAAAVTMGTITIEGSEVTTSFDKSNIDEAKIEAENVLLGTLKLKSAASDYTINSYSVCLSNAEVVSTEIKDLTLGGNSYDSLVLDAATLFCPAGYDEYKFEDISLNAGQQVSLQLAVDFEDTVSEDDDLSVDVSFDNHIDVTDEDNDEDYDQTNISDIFSTTSFTEKTLTIQGPTFDLAVTTLNNRTVVLGTQEEIVYKGKINVGDADTVKLQSITFNDVGTVADLSDVIQSASLVIDGKTYSDTDIQTTMIKFSNINHVFAASASDVNVELIVKLKTDDLAGGTPTIILSTKEADLTLKDADGDLLAAANVTLVDNDDSCTLTLNEEGQLTVSYETDDNSSTTMNNFTEQDKFALAGAADRVVLAKLKLKADREDMRIEKLTFTFDDVAGDFYNSYNNMYFRLDGATTDIGTAKVTYATNVTTVEYTFPTTANFTVSKSTPKYAYLYATVKARNEDPNAAEVGAIDGSSVENLDVTAVEFKGLSSNLDEVDLTLVDDADAGDAYNTTVVVNTIANVELKASVKTITVGTHVVGTIVVTPTTQTTNLDADGDVINALIGNLNLDRALTDCTLTSLSIRKVGSTTTVALADNADTALAGLGTDAEIKGTTTYELVAVVATVADTATAAVQLVLNDVTTEVDFLSMTAGTALSRLLPEGVSKEQVVSTK